MEWTAMVRLGLIGYAVVGIAYACIGSGFLQNGQSGWWDELPKPKRIAFGTGVAASLLQMFL